MAFALKLNKTTIVPWFSMSEWETVYKQVYSDDAVEQKKGYERLLVWKARCPALPAGVECTLGLIHVCLQDREIWSQIVSGALPPYREHDLRLMYSTAIMRFLNHISIVAQDGTETMYKMAKKLHIPDWVVNIRHDVAHGSSLPPLSVLREAMNFTLDWIHEHYWKGESELTTDYIANKDTGTNVKVIQDLQEYIELWQALKLYDEASYKDVISIPDEQLKSQLCKVMERSPKRGVFASQLVFGASENGDSPEKGYATGVLKSWKTKEILDQLLKHLGAFVRQNHSVLNESELVVKALLEGESLLPGVDVLDMLNMGGEGSESLPMGLKQLWHHILVPLQTANILPILLHSLMELTCKKGESIHRRQAAAVWVKELCTALLKAQGLQALKEIYNSKPDHVHSKGMKAKKIKIQMSDEFDSNHPEWKNAFSLKMTNLPDMNLELVERVMLSPNKWTRIFLPSLLDLVRPALPASVKQNLLGVLEVYTSEVIPIHDGDVEVDGPPLYTVASLGEEDEVERSGSGETADMDMDVDAPEQELQEAGGGYLSGWEKSEAYLDWKNCPIGVLPWQRELSSINFDISSDVQWKPVRPRVAFENVKRGLPGNFQKSINWNEIIQKKRPKKNKHHGVNYVKKAFQAVTGI